MSDFSNHSCQADLFVPSIKIKRLTTASFKGLIQSFGAVKAPTNVYSIDAERGGRLELEAVNTMNMLRLLQIVLICVSKQVVEEAMPHASEEVWSYLDPQDRRRGPFSALKLHKWLKHGHLHRDFLCQHGPSRVWIPIWLLCTHYESAAVASGALGTTTQHLGEVVPTKRAVTLEHQKDPDSDVEMEDVAVQVLELRNDQVFSQALCTAADMDVDEESIPKPSVSLPDPAVHNVAYYPPESRVQLPGGVIRHQSRWTATTSAAGHASSSRTSAAGHASSSRATIPSSGSAADDAGTVATPGRRQVVTAASPSSSVVEVITKGGAAGIDMAAALSMLASVDTGDKGCQSRSLLSASEVIPQLPSLLGGGRGEAAAAAGSWRLYLVLDTNLLLMRSTLRLVEQIRLNYGPQSTASRAAAGDAEYHSDGSSRVGGVVVGSLQAERAPFGHHHQQQHQRLLEVVVLVPWVVLQELDGLKGRGDGTGEVASMARTAIKVLRAGLDDDGRFFQGQSLQEYRDASQLYSDPLGGIISADDRILYCCLHFQDMLGCRVVNHKQNHSLGQQQQQQHLEGRKCRLVLLTNDNNLRNKADFSSVRCFDGSSIPLSSDPSLLVPYLLQLLGLSKQQLQQLQSMKADHRGTAITAVRHAVQRHSPASGVTPTTSSSTGSSVGIEASLGTTVQQLQQQYTGCHVAVHTSHDGMDVDEAVLDDSRAAAGEAPLQTQPSSSHHQYSTTAMTSSVPPAVIIQLPASSLPCSSLLSYQHPQNHTPQAASCQLSALPSQQQQQQHSNPSPSLLPALQSNDNKLLFSVQTQPSPSPLPALQSNDKLLFSVQTQPSPSQLSSLIPLLSPLVHQQGHSPPAPSPQHAMHHDHPHNQLPALLERHTSEVSSHTDNHSCCPPKHVTEAFSSSVVTSVVPEAVARMSFTASGPALEYKQSTFSVPSSLTATSTTTSPSSRGDANNQFVFAAERQALQAFPSSTKMLPTATAAAGSRQALQASLSSTVLPAAAERQALQTSPSLAVLPAAAERQALQASPSLAVLPAAAERQALQASPSLAVLPAAAATAAERSSVYEEVMALTEQLGPQVEGWLREEFDQLFDHVVCRKLPWKNDDILAVLSRHWDTVALRVRSPQETKRLVAGMLEVSKQNIRDRRRSVKGFCLQADELRKAFGLL